MNHRESQALFEGIKIAIAMQQRMSLPDAKGGDQAINRLANRLPLAPKDSEVPSCRYREFSTAGREYIASAEFGKHNIESLLVGDALQNLAENDVNQTEPLAHELGLQPSHLGIADVPEIVNPHCGINDDHIRYSATRPCREAERSPSQRTFPFNRRIPFCP
jgi:hypothetical protein